MVFYLLTIEMAFAQSFSFLDETISKNTPASDEFMNSKIIQPLNQMFSQTWRNIYNIYGDVSNQNKLNSFLTEYRPLNSFDVLKIYDSRLKFSPQMESTTNIEFESKGNQNSRIKRDKVAGTLLESIGIKHSRNDYSQFRLSRESKQSKIVNESNNIKKCCTIRPSKLKSKFDKRNSAQNPNMIQNTLIGKLKELVERKQTYKKCRAPKVISLKREIPVVHLNNKTKPMKINGFDHFIKLINSNLRCLKKLKKSCTFIEKLTNETTKMSNDLTEEIGGYNEIDKKKFTASFRQRNSAHYRKIYTSLKGKRPPKII